MFTEQLKKAEKLGSGHCISHFKKQTPICKDILITQDGPKRTAGSKHCSFPWEKLPLHFLDRTSYKYVHEFAFYL